MSACWASRHHRLHTVAALAATIALSAPLPTQALPLGRITTHVRERGPSRIEINDHGVTVVTRARASAGSGAAHTSVAASAATVWSR